MKRILFTFGFVSILLISACDFEAAKKAHTQENIMQKPSQVSITLGDSFDGFIERYPSVKKKHQDTKQWGFLNWYQFNWPTKKAARIFFKAKHYKISIAEVIYLSLLEDSDFTKEGIIEISLQAGLSADDWIDHDAARSRFYAILQDFMDNGWQYALGYSAPRLTGKESVRYKLNEESFHYLDPGYFPTLNEWKALEQGAAASNYWVLHDHNNAFMEIRLGIQNHKTDPDKAAYLMFIEINNDQNEAKKYFSSDTSLPVHRGNWNEHWLERLEKAANTRQKRELAAIQKGYSIDLHYLDFYIRPGKEKTREQLENEIRAVTFRVGEVAPREGYYEATLPEGHPQFGMLKSNHMRYVIYQKGDTFRPFGLSDETEKQIRWIWVVN